MLAFVMAHLQTLKLDRRAVTTIEYGLIAAMVALVIVNGLSSLGKDVALTFNRVSSEL